MRFVILTICIALSSLLCAQNEYFRSQVVRSATVQIGSTKTVKIGKNVQIGGGVKGERWYLLPAEKGSNSPSFTLKESKQARYALVFDEHMVLQVIPLKDTCAAVKPEDMYGYQLTGDTLQLNLPNTNCSLNTIANKKFRIIEYKKEKMVWKPL